MPVRHKVVTDAETTPEYCDRVLAGSGERYIPLQRGRDVVAHCKARGLGIVGIETYRLDEKLHALVDWVYDASPLTRHELTWEQFVARAAAGALDTVERCEQAFPQGDVHLSFMLIESKSHLHRE